MVLAKGKIGTSKTTMEYIDSAYMCVFSVSNFGNIRKFVSVFRNIPNSLYEVGDKLLPVFIGDSRFADSVIR